MPVPIHFTPDLSNFLCFVFSLATFQDKESVGNLVKLIDKSNGYIFAGIDASAVEFSKIAVGPVDWDYYRYPFYFDSTIESLRVALYLVKILVNYTTKYLELSFSHISICIIKK